MEYHEVSFSRQCERPSSPASVERAPYAERAGVDDMGVDHGRCDVGVTEQLLDGADVVAGFEQVGREGVAKGVAGGWLGYAGSLDCGTEAALDHGLVQVVAPELTRGWVEVAASGWEHPLPGPLAMGTRVLGGERTGQCDVAGASDEIRVVLDLDAANMVFEGHSQAVGEQGQTILSAFSAPHGDLAGGEVDVLDAQLSAFEQSKTGAIHERCHELRHAVHLIQNGLDLVSREYDRKGGSSARSRQLVYPWRSGSKDRAVEKDQGTERLLLRTRAGTARG